MSKLNSRKFWIVIWSLFIITGWGTYSLIVGKTLPWLTGTMALLVAIPAGYVAIGTAKKKAE